MKTLYEWGSYLLSPYSLMEFLDSVSLPLMLQLGSFISPFFFFALLFFSALYTSCICIKFLINCNYLLKKNIIMSLSCSKITVLGCSAMRMLQLGHGCLQ